MPRTREFTLDEALNRALEVFWCYGYEASSIQRLVDRTGVQRGSLYATFGDKHHLFIRVLRYYMEVVFARHLRYLYESPTGLPAIERFFGSIVEFSINDPDGKGCLVTNTLAELASSDRVIAAELETMMASVENAFYQALVQAQAAGQIGMDRDPHELAGFLIASLQGMRIMARLRPEAQRLHRLQRSILSAIH